MSRNEQTRKGKLCPAPFPKAVPALHKDSSHCFNYKLEALTKVPMTKVTLNKEILDSRLYCATQNCQETSPGSDCGNLRPSHVDPGQLNVGPAELAYCMPVKSPWYRHTIMRLWLKTGSLVHYPCFVCVWPLRFWCVCVCVPEIAGPLQPKLWAIVSHPVWVLGTILRFSWKNSECSSLLRHLPKPLYSVFQLSLCSPGWSGTRYVKTKLASNI